MLTSPITGGTITGLTTPGYVLTADVAPNALSKQWAVTGITGTQPSVDTGSSPARPWTLTWSRPQNIRQLNAVDSNNVLRSVPMNSYGFRVRKGLTPLAGQPSKTASAYTTFDIPAGSDVADVPNIKALVSCYMGAVAQSGNNMVTLFTTGVMP